MSDTKSQLARALDIAIIARDACDSHASAAGVVEQYGRDVLRAEQADAVEALESWLVKAERIRDGDDADLHSVEYESGHVGGVKRCLQILKRRAL